MLIAFKQQHHIQTKNAINHFLYQNIPISHNGFFCVWIFFSLSFILNICVCICMCVCVYAHKHEHISIWNDIEKNKRAIKREGISVLRICEIVCVRFLSFFLLSLRVSLRLNCRWFHWLHAFWYIHSINKWKIAYKLIACVYDSAKCCLFFFFFYLWRQL